jgi:hypothetical protein
MGWMMGGALAVCLAYYMYREGKRLGSRLGFRAGRRRRRGR